MRKITLNSIGTTSLALSILAVIIPWFLLIRDPFETTELFFFVLFDIYDRLIFYVLSIIGSITGIISRKTNLGKAGMLISTISLGYMICFRIFIVCYFIYMDATGQTWFWFLSKYSLDNFDFTQDKFTQGMPSTAKHKYKTPE